jgi:hypothetical protein
MKNHKTILLTLIVLLLANGGIKTAKADEMQDLISIVIDASPAEKAKAAQFTKKKTKSKFSASSKGTSIPNLGIPEDQLLEASSKFPKDYVGKYVYGALEFRGVSEIEEEPGVMFNALNGRSFTLWTKDQAVLDRFKAMPWKTKLIIPKECPLRILSKGLFTYMLRMPFDQGTDDHMH